MFNVNQPTKKISRQEIPTFLPRTATQEQRVRHYIETRWNEQYRYYTAKAEQNRKLHQRLQLFIAVVAVLVPVLLGFTGGIVNWITSLANNPAVGLVTSKNGPLLVEIVNAIPAILSGFVAAAAAAENVMKYGDNWRAFQSASDGMERERALFEANAAMYLTAPNPYKLFVERSEDVISQETGRYFARQQAQNQQGEDPEDLFEELLGIDIDGDDDDGDDLSAG